MTEEIVPDGRAIFQSDRAKTYQCPICRRSIFSQYQGDEMPEVVCRLNEHKLIWHHLSTISEPV